MLELSKQRFGDLIFFCLIISLLADCCANKPESFSEMALYYTLCLELVGNELSFGLKNVTLTKQTSP